MTLKKQPSNFVKHIPCEQCGSSDGNSLYDDGHEYCHVCSAYVASGSDSGSAANDDGNHRSKQPKKAAPMVALLKEHKSIPDRALTLSTVEKYGVSVSNGKHYYPYFDTDGVLCAYKVRDVEHKQFTVQGSFTGVNSSTIVMDPSLTT